MVRSHTYLPRRSWSAKYPTDRSLISGWDSLQEEFADETIPKWDIFCYVYAVLHHPEYRAKYAENLKRELPRIPLVGGGTGVSPVAEHGQDGRATPTFWAFAKAGKDLAKLHVDYESVEPYPLKYIEMGAAFGVRDLAPAFVLPKQASANKAAASRRTPKGAQRAPLPLSYRVEDKMRLAKDRKSLKVNDTLTLAGIPPEAFEYRLGNRSALEWVIDEYQVTEDKRSGIRSDPNRADDPEYIVKLVGRVIRVSVETVRIVKSLPAF